MAFLGIFRNFRIGQSGFLVKMGVSLKLAQGPFLAKKCASAKMININTLKCNILKFQPIKNICRFWSLVSPTIKDFIEIAFKMFWKISELGSRVSILHIHIISPDTSDNYLVSLTLTKHQLRQQKIWNNSVCVIYFNWFYFQQRSYENVHFYPLVR